ncbi:hypothetical protein ACFWN1_30745 [Streptomyces sp. NPDC058459]|uniref:hypothetical protein n=1 Tax=Streptomyces sp. NPDC058459 TaxID=3346508 RepID=UPI00365BF986
MRTRPVQISVKARDRSALGRFRAAALGWKVTGDTPDEPDVEPEGFGVLVPL